MPLLVEMGLTDLPKSGVPCHGNPESDRPDVTAAVVVLFSTYFRAVGRSENMGGEIATYNVIFNFYKVKGSVIRGGGKFSHPAPPVPTALYSTRSVDGHKAANRGWCAIQQSVHRNIKEF